MNSIATPLWFSIRVCLGATIIASVTGIACAYLLAKTKSRFKVLLEALFTVPIVLPPTVLGYYLLTLLGSRGVVGKLFNSIGVSLVFTPTAAVIAASVSAFPFVVRTARAAISQVPPALEKQGRVNGLSETQVCFNITLPCAARGLRSAVALGFARALGDFGITVMIAGNIEGQTQTLPVALYSAVSAGDYATARNGALILLGFGLLMLVFVIGAERE